MNKNFSLLRPAKSIEINQRVYELKRSGVNVITLSLGEAYFDIPDFGFSTIDHSVGYHYCDTQGLPVLREKIIEYFEKFHNISNLTDDNIIISAGSKILTYLCMNLLLNKNDEVLLHEPAWLSYEDQAKLSNATVNYIPYDKSINDFSNYLSTNTKLVVINNPNNPAGWIYDYNDLKSFIELCASKSIYVLVDEAYSDFVYSDSNFKTAADLVNEFNNLIVVNSISKNFGMSGWRVGFAISSASITKNLSVMSQHTITCAPTVLQMYLADNLFKIHEFCLGEISKLIQKRRALKNIISDLDLEVLQGGATFYFFLNIEKTGYDSDTFCLMLLEKHRIATVPGSAYGKGTGSFIRLSFGTESVDVIESALKLISSYMEN